MERAYPILVADIGGTNARFGLVHGKGESPTDIKKLAGDDYPSLHAALGSYLASIEPSKPHRGCIAVAGPVEPGKFILTNRTRWNTTLSSLKAAYRLDVLDVINDFQALAAALPSLAPDELWPIGKPTTGLPGGTLAVVGPGTGLGVGAAVKTGLSWQAIPGEGGHVELANPNPRARAAIDHVAKSLGRVSAERFLSGPGLELLHATLGKIDGVSREPLDAAAIQLSASGGNADALDTIAVFLTLLAGFAGDVGLMFGARGGVFLAGGVAAQLKKFIRPEIFRRDFENKGRLQPFMAAIPTFLIASETLALRGCAAHLDAMLEEEPRR
ncbi:MAG TPA: glucokinase [Aestuariivirgaceae bacterium]|jgi:glucokinase